jgi:hypothetical protein
LIIQPALCRSEERQPFKTWHTCRSQGDQHRVQQRVPFFYAAHSHSDHYSTGGGYLFRGVCEGADEKAGSVNAMTLIVRSKKKTNCSVAVLTEDFLLYGRTVPRQKCSLIGVAEVRKSRYERLHFVEIASPAGRQ